MLNSYSLQHLGPATNSNPFGVPAGVSGECVAAMTPDRVSGVALVNPVSLGIHGHTRDVGGVNLIGSWKSPSVEDLKESLQFVGHSFVPGTLDANGPRFIPHKPPTSPKRGVAL